LIYQYTGSTKIAVVDRNWKTLPDATSEYSIVAHPGREHVNEGLAQAGTANTITLNTLASDQDNAYNYQLIFLRSGTGEDQVGLVTAYNGTTKIATIDKNWDIIPDSTTGYAMLPNHIDYADMASAVWADTVGVAIETMTTELHKLQGLLAGKPMTVTPSSRTVDDISQTISGDGETSTTVTRDP
jgi:hypothetical protein